VAVAAAAAEAAADRRRRRLYQEQDAATPPDMQQSADTQHVSVSATAQPSGWSFLVAPRRTEGHLTVLAPDFLTERNRECVLLDSLPGDGAIAARCRLLTVEDDELGRMTVLCTSDQLALGENVIDCDEHGRPLGVVYGVVTRGRHEGLAEELLRMARAQSLDTYRRFLDRDDACFLVESSRPFALRTG